MMQNTERGSVCKREIEKERHLLRSDYEIKEGWQFLISFHSPTDRHTQEFINDCKPHYAIAYLDNKQTRFHYYTFVER